MDRSQRAMWIWEMTLGVTLVETDDHQQVLCMEMTSRDCTFIGSWCGL